MFEKFQFNKSELWVWPLIAATSPKPTWNPDVDVKNGNDSAVVKPYDWLSNDIFNAIMKDENHTDGMTHFISQIAKSQLASIQNGGMENINHTEDLEVLGSPPSNESFTSSR